MNIYLYVNVLNDISRATTRKAACLVIALEKPEGSAKGSGTIGTSSNNHSMIVEVTRTTVLVAELRAMTSATSKDATALEINLK